MWYVCITYGKNVRITFRFCSSLHRHLFVIVYYVTITLFIYLLELRYILVRSNYVWKWRDNDVSCLFLIVTYFLLRYNYVIYLFDVVTFFDDARNRFYFDTFGLRMEMTWKLHFFFIRYRNVFFITSQLCYVFVRCSHVL